MLFYIDKYTFYSYLLKIFIAKNKKRKQNVRILRNMLIFAPFLKRMW